MNEDVLRDCYEVLGACGMQRPSWEQWRSAVENNGEVWPIRRQEAGAMRTIGFVLFKGHSIHIAVEPQWRGRWITKVMLRAWREHYSHDCDLYATPDADNDAACRLAERLGFRLQRTLGKSAIYVKERSVCPQPL